MALSVVLLHGTWMTFYSGFFARRPPALRLVLFVFASLLALLAAGPLLGFTSGLFRIAEIPGWLFPALVSSVLLVVSWGALRLEGQGLDVLGLVPTRRRLGEFAVGFAFAVVLFGGVALVRAASVGAGWTFDLEAGLWAAVIGLPVAFVLMFSEELLFRGYAFRKAEEAWGAPAALVVSSVAFGAYHVVGEGMWGMGAFFLFAMPLLGGLVFGLAAQRTGGLALPTGLHLGGNWVNASVFGLAVPEGSALWTAPLDAAQISFLTAPDVVPRLPYITAVVLLLVIVARWPRMKPVAAS